MFEFFTKFVFQDRKESGLNILVNV